MVNGPYMECLGHQMRRKIHCHLLKEYNSGTFLHFCFAAMLKNADLQRLLEGDGNAEEGNVSVEDDDMKFEFGFV